MLCLGSLIGWTFTTDDVSVGTHGGFKVLFSPRLGLSVSWLVAFSLFTAIVRVFALHRHCTQSLALGDRKWYERCTVAIQI